MRRVRGMGLLLVGSVCVAVAVGCRTGELDFGVFTAPPSQTPTPEPTYGSGATGPLTVDTPTIVNHCHRVVLSSSATATLDSTTNINAGDRLLFVAMQDNLDSVAGAGFAQPTGNAGLWELARAQSVQGTTLVVTAPLSRRYRSSSGGGTKLTAAQVCTVPEYTDLTIDASGAIVAAPWDGNTGGIAAVLVKTKLTLNGSIDVSGLGFRGGQSPSISSLVHSTDGYASLTSGHGARGESLDAINFGTSADGGREASVNGGGGGNPSAAGGAGGSNGGGGGDGGLETTVLANGTANTPNVLTGGLGASGIGASASPVFWIGGGGGSGARAQTGSTTGGAGGGGIFVGAQAIEGNGSILANGASGTTQTSNQLGSGGGGAGGTIIIFTPASPTSTFAGSISATGGNGGDSAGAGPGGGGGGGRVSMPASITVAPNVGGGSRGTFGGSGRGATSGGQGLVN